MNDVQKEKFQIRNLRKELQETQEKYKSLKKRSKARKDEIEYLNRKLKNMGKEKDQCLKTAEENTVVAHL